MPDIKLDQQKEMAPAVSEQAKDLGEKLKSSLENFNHGEKAKKLEQARQGMMEEISQSEKALPAAALPVGGVIAPQAKLQKQVENVLAEGMAEVYLDLAPDKRREFKKAGEETAKKISQLLAKTKINMGEIIKLIKKWLALIPGVNSYFLEQEAKIKADELIRLNK